MSKSFSVQPWKNGMMKSVRLTNGNVDDNILLKFWNCMKRSRINWSPDCSHWNYQRKITTCSTHCECKVHQTNHCYNNTDTLCDLVANESISSVFDLHKFDQLSALKLINDRTLLHIIRYTHS